MSAPVAYVTAWDGVVHAVEGEPYPVPVLSVGQLVDLYEVLDNMLLAGFKNTAVLMRHLIVDLRNL